MAEGRTAANRRRGCRKLNCPLLPVVAYTCDEGYLFFGLLVGKSARMAFAKDRRFVILEDRMGAQSAQKHHPPATEIPDRLYFRIGDVAKICGVEPYVLRFWETQFPNLKPNKGGTGQRLYRRREVELALRIRQLVHSEGYTLAGARQALEVAPRPRNKQQGVLPLTSEQAQQRLDGAIAAIGRVRAELRELARQLAVEEPTVQRRRSRIAAFKTTLDPLFPA
jgi:DNA-binding transcriptional MerR regulator